MIAEALFMLRSLHPPKPPPVLELARSRELSESLDLICSDLETCAGRLSDHTPER